MNCGTKYLNKFYKNKKNYFFLINSLKNSLEMIAKLTDIHENLYFIL